jgi:hypothetical protein
MAKLKEKPLLVCADRPPDLQAKFALCLQIYDGLHRRESRYGEISGVGM